jgi:hypothetical protein
MIGAAGEGRGVARPRSVARAIQASVNSSLDTIRLTNPQRQFVSLPWRKAVWRGPNTVGKSVALAWHLVHCARGTHPYAKLLNLPPPPVRLLVVSESWTQMDPLCEKIYGFLPKNEIDDRVEYETGGGFSGMREPRIPFVAGPGNPRGHATGSVIHFGTYKQGAKRIAGGQYHGIAADEPMPDAVFGELQPRTSRFHAWQRFTFTPTPESPDLTYLRELLAKSTKYHAKHGRWHPGHWREMQTAVDLDAMTPRGGLVEVPWKTQRELDELIDSYLEIERGMRTRGDWDPIVGDRILTAYGPANLTHETELPAGRVWYLCVALDHGAKAGRQAVVLVACSEDGEEIRYFDEVVSDGRTSSREDAIAILEMLRRHGWTWADVDHWVGDRSHGGDRFGNAKSNDDLMKEFAAIIGLTEYQLRGKGLDLITPFKDKGSVYRGLRLMNGLFKSRRAIVHSRCIKLIEGITGWAGAKDDPLKDRVDAARYGTERLHDERRLRPYIPTAVNID